MLRQQLFASIIESELSESELSEFIKTRTLPERMKKQIFDQDYIKKHQKVMTKRTARDISKPVRQLKRSREKVARAGFPDTRPLFKTEDLEMIVDEMCGADHGKKKKKVDEQMMAARGSSFDKMAARQSGAVAPVSKPPVDRSAAYEKQKQVWSQQAAAKRAAVPPQVARQRTPIPAAPRTPVAIKPAAPAAPVTRPLTPGGMMRRPAQPPRPLRTRL
jgi:hypothetical protein